MVVTDATGTAYYNVSSLATGNFPVVISFGGSVVTTLTLTVNPNISLEVINGSDFTVNKTTLFQNTPVVFTAIVKDNNGNIIPSQSVTFTPSSGSQLS